MNDLKFICRVKAGTERKTLLEAERRTDSAWLPFSLESTRRRRKREPVATIRPIMPYLFCEATHDQMMRLLQYRDIFAPTWFIPKWQERQVADYRAKVEAEFNENRQAYLTDANVFHCNFKPGQAVQLRNEGMDLFAATFKAINDDGRYELEAEMFGQSVPITAEPQNVTG